MRCLRSMPLATSVAMGGRFDDLLAKAVVHYLMSAAGAGVPSREIALAPENPLVTWASATDPGTDLRSWLESRLGEMKPSFTAEPQLRLLLLRTFYRCPVRYRSVSGRRRTIRPAISLFLDARKANG